MCPNALPALLRDEKLQPGSSRSPQEGQLPPADLHQTASGACCCRDVVGLVSAWSPAISCPWSQALCISIAGRQQQSLQERMRWDKRSSSCTLHCCQ